MAELVDAVVVVGAGPGMGLAIGRRFAAEGYLPVFVVREGGTLETPDLDSVVIGADASDEASLKAAFAHIRESVGDPAVMVFNPSAWVDGLPSEVTPNALAAGLRLGALGAVASSQAVLPAMRAAGRGTLLFTGSVAATNPSLTGVGLGMQKAAMRNYVLALAKEVGPHGIHAATITIQGSLGSAPGYEPEALAEHFWALHAQPRADWQPELLATG